MFVYTLLFTGLLGLLGTSAEQRCRPFGVEIKTIENLIKENKKCPCEETFGIDGDYNQTECKCFEVPKIQDNCNLTCFRKGFEKPGYLTKKRIQDFNKRVLFCRAEMFDCFKPCDDMENVTASTFWKSVVKIMHQMNSQLKNTQLNNTQLEDNHLKKSQ